MKYKISDLSKVLGVTTNTIRHYEKDGYITPERDQSDYRWYKGFDISKTAIIRLLIKCGFSHSEIKEMFNNSSSNIKDIYTNRLDEIDKELKRLHFLRHWLKDNIQLKTTIENIGDGYTTMVCPSLEYVLYSKGDTIYNEPQRLQTIYDFMYTIPEVQLMQLFKYDEFTKDDLVSYHGWAMKTIDIERLAVKNIIKNSPYIETYPSVNCLFGVLNIPSKDIENNEAVTALRKQYWSKTKDYMQKNNMEINGDIMELYVTVLGDTVSSLVCTPFKKLN